MPRDKTLLFDPHFKAAWRRTGCERNKDHTKIGRQQKSNSDRGGQNVKSILVNKIALPGG